MTKTPKNGSSSSTPTPTPTGGGPGSGNNAPPSVGSTKSESEAAENPVLVDNRSGTPASLGSDKDHGTPGGGGGGNPNPGLTPVHDPELNGSELCDNNPNADPSSVPNNNPGSIPDNDNVVKSGADLNPNDNLNNSVKQESDIKTENNDLAAPNPGSSSSTSGQHQNSSSSVPDLPSDAADLFDGFDTKDGVKDEAIGNDTSDNLAALTDFKEEDLKPFDDACNEFSNGKENECII